MATAAAFRREHLEGYVAPLAKPGLFEHALSIVRTWTQDLRELEATLPKLREYSHALDVGQQGSARCMFFGAPLARILSEFQVDHFSWALDTCPTKNVRRSSTGS